MIYPVDSAIQRLNNWGLVSSCGDLLILLIALGKINCQPYPNTITFLVAFPPNLLIRSLLPMISRFNDYDLPKHKIEVPLVLIYFLLVKRNFAERGNCCHWCATKHESEV